MIGILFAGALGAAVADMTPQMVMTFPSLNVCYAAMALGINELNRQHPIWKHLGGYQ